jgi:hypothetical protein
MKVKELINALKGLEDYEFCVKFHKERPIRNIPVIFGSYINEKEKEKIVSLLLSLTKNVNTKNVNTKIVNKLKLDTPTIICRKPCHNINSEACSFCYNNIANSNSYEEVRQSINNIHEISFKVKGNKSLTECPHKMLIRGEIRPVGSNACKLCKYNHTIIENSQKVHCFHPNN